MKEGAKTRQDEWMRSIAVGSRSFVEKEKDVTEGIKGDQLREEAVPYNALFGVKKDDIATQNTYFWNIKVR